MKRKGILISVDGVTGSGKSTVLKAVHEWAQNRGQKIFRLHEWEAAEPPSFEDVSDYDVLFTYEPTRTWLGAAIRYEMSQTDNPYGGEELAHAFALDRQINYRRLIIPALEAGKIVIQDRSVSSSIIIQPTMEGSMPLEKLLELPGNKLALEHAPDALVLTKLSAETAFERIKTRSDESKGVFADISSLKKQEERFASKWFRELFTKNGTEIWDLDTSLELSQTQERAKQIIHQILSTR